MNPLSDSKKEDDRIYTPVDEWIKNQPFETTEDIKIPPRLIDQVIGQGDAVKVIRKAAEQKRHVLLIGEPGTGKSMLANSMVEFLPRGELQDVIAYHNPEDPNEPRIRIVPAGKGKDIVKAQKIQALQKKEQKGQMMLMILIMIVGLAFVFSIQKTESGWTINPMIIFLGILAAIMLFMVMRYSGQREEKAMVPKLLVTHKPDDLPPFIDGTGAHAGALLGDVKHDPFQSGGLETPAHERLEAGAIHKANKGVLFIDEINMLKMESQQSLLTSMQEGKFSILGQSERSSGAMVKSEPVPTDFILVAAGNLDSIYGARDKDGITRGGMHPALRSRIRGYGYEIYMKTTMDDTEENRRNLIRFVAQEVAKDRKIPHFEKMAVAEIIHEAQRRSGRRGQLTLRLRELGGLIRVAGDIAQEGGAKHTSFEHVLQAKKIARSLEQQIADRYIERRKEYEQLVIEGNQVGMVNGLAVMGGDTSMAEYSGIVLPINAEVTPALKKERGEIIATGQLGELAKESVLNVSALIKKYTGRDISNYDVHIQFVGSRDGTEGDSASISVATAVISALEDIPVKQSLAMTGSLSIRGNVLPVGGVTAKVEAAADAGIGMCLIPKANMKDLMLETKYKGKIEVIPVETLRDVLKYALVGAKKEGLLKKLASLVVSPHSASTVEKPAPQ